MSIRSLLLILPITLLLAACSEPVTVGSKSPIQDRLLAEMFAQLIEQEGVSVERRFALGDGTENYQAMRDGLIDAYPEYTGTILTQIGKPTSTDPQQALQNARTALSQVGLEVLDPLGFNSTYDVITRKDFAKEHGIRTMSDLRRTSGKFRLGVTTSFATRVADGLNAWMDQYGLSFADVDIAPGENRAALYNNLIDDKVDIIVGLSTDPEIIDYGLVTLQDNRKFFPDYQVAPVVTDAALKRQPEVLAALTSLTGKVDTTKMQALTRQAQYSGRSIQSVAAEALADMELISGTSFKKERPLLIATEPSEIGSATANLTLRAVRTAMPGRGVGLLGSQLPLEDVTNRTARLALVPSIAHFDIIDGEISQNTRFETLAVVGTTYVHALALDDGPSELGQAKKIAAGPEGTASYKLASAAAASQQPEGQVLTLQDSSIVAAVDALITGQADAAITLAAGKSRELEDELKEAANSVRLIPAADWWQGAARLKLPIMHQATLAGGFYDGQSQAIHTLAMQTTLVGPAPSDTSPLGRSGPSTFTDAALPLPDTLILAINQALGAHPDVSPYLRKAAALVPIIDQERTVLNPSPSHAILMLAIFAYLALAGWLFIRRQPHA